MEIRLSGEDREVLARWAQGGAGELSRRAMRARIVLACAEPGSANARVAAALGLPRPTVICWRRRFAQAGLAGLADAKRGGRPKAELRLTDAERARLTRWARQASTAQGLALRARIVLACAAGRDNKDVAADLRVAEATVARWRRRFLASRLHSLTDQTPRKNEKKLIAIAAPASGKTSRVDSRPKPGGGAVLAAERRDLLVARLERDGKLIAKDVAAEFGLSDDSIRRDLRDLAAAGLCQRVYGGALPRSPAMGRSQAVRFRIAPESKQRIAAAAARLITPGSTVILDGGTTALEVVMALPPDLEATIITRSATTAAALAAHPKVAVHILSGRLHKQSVSALGVAAAEAASAVSADIALLTIPAVHPQEGLTAADPELAAMHRILFSRAAIAYAMASTEKLGTVGPYKVTGLSDVNAIITDAPAGNPIIRQLRARGATIIQAI